MMLDGFSTAWGRLVQTSERTLVSIQAWDIPGLIRMRQRNDSRQREASERSERTRKARLTVDLPNRSSKKSSHGRHAKSIEQREVDQMRPKHATALLSNFQQIFGVSDAWIERFAHALLEDDTKLILFFVDLDNVPRFFKTFTIKVLQQIERRMHCETFVVCASCQPYELKRMRGGNWNQEHLSRVHFTLANKHKDSADAVCAVAQSKLDSLLVACGRQQDARAIICSEDKIFQQVDDLLRKGSSLSGIASKTMVARPGNLFGLKLWQCECGRVFSSECAIEQHRGASHNPRCLLDAPEGDRDGHTAARPLASSCEQKEADLGQPLFQRRHRSRDLTQSSGRIWAGLGEERAMASEAQRRVKRASSPINETLQTLAAFLTTTLSRQGGKE